jgi:hypothetical protein
MRKDLFLLVLSAICMTLSAAVPGKIPVQGTLMDKDGNLVNDDAAQITFTIYDAESDGNDLWSEDRTLLINNGVMAVYLGEIEPITYELIGGQDELWLSVTYDGEEMSRIQLGSVPYAHEAEVAHNAEAVGKYTETTLDDYFSSACAEGSYLRGWSGTSPICETDEGGESGGTTYTAGTGISIDGEVISVDQTIDLYVAGTGIYIDEGTNTISVNPSIFATTDHNHDSRYYLKGEVYNKSEVYTKSESDGRYHNDGDLIKTLNGTNIKGFAFHNQWSSSAGAQVAIVYKGTQLTTANSFCAVRGFVANYYCEVKIDADNKWWVYSPNGDLCSANCLIWNW